MRRLLLPLVVALLVGAVAFSAGSRWQEQPPAAAGDKTPWTNLNFNNADDTFRFAIVSDRTGGHREGIFSKAVAQLNLMQPEFVMSVGDLIEGYSEKDEAIAGMWKEFDNYVSKLTMPFFRVPGNHDTANTTMQKYWKNKFGQIYYHFVYKNVLFLCAHTEDFPEGTKQATRISPEQTAYFAKVLAENKNVRHTIVFMHRPIWTQVSFDDTGFTAFENQLLDRPYTVFAGHIHHYQKFVRHGRNYYQLATTGGGSKMRGLQYGEFDQIAWVTMKKDTMVMANVMLNGILPEDLSVVESVAEEKGVIAKDRRELVAASGKVLLNGQPVENAEVVFYYQVPEAEQIKLKGQKQIRTSDAVTNARGEFTLSTYTNNDGVPKGEFIVVVTPFKTKTGLPVIAPDIPVKYTKPATSPLKVTLKEAKLDMVLDVRE
ncbi:MAG TPA: metallophosphoesterase [Gemmatales bacterium]|nr:metallophosphoesterase [Gemmatales bacterium]